MGTGLDDKPPRTPSGGNLAPVAGTLNNRAIPAAADHALSAQAIRPARRPLPCRTSGQVCGGLRVEGRLNPCQKKRAIYIRGHSDGERGVPPRSSEYGGWQREIYESAYSKGFSCRYTAEQRHRQHGNKGRVGANRHEPRFAD